MDPEEKRLIIVASVIGFIAAILGAAIGGYCTLQGVYWSWDQQEKALDEQKSLEQQNMATALYYDISTIEDKFNGSMRDVLRDMNNDINKLNDPNYIYFEDTKYFSVNWIYYVFGKDIAGFDSNISTDLYAFYGNAAEIDYYMQYVRQMGEKAVKKEPVKPYEILLAHTYTKGIYGLKIPQGILLAENIKRELREKHYVNLRLHPITPDGDVQTSFHLQKNFTTDSSTLTVNYH